ncbi:hypothetical protein D0437_30275 [Bacillus cereus]|uniref:Spore germination GerAC-like C-terminal domain-containing protein n=1 Tax=Bacillus cereus TaxID=1396 RepID=A0A9X7QNK2_BACCE|nr:hypothetical protein D0437_30275 [Bacillus cereus]
MHSSLAHQHSMKQLQQVLANEMKKQLQTQYKLDVIGIGDKYQRQHFKKWKEIENDWENGKRYSLPVTFVFTYSLRLYNLDRHCQNSAYRTYLS